MPPCPHCGGPTEGCTHLEQDWHGRRGQAIGIARHDAPRCQRPFVVFPAGRGVVYWPVMEPTTRRLELGLPVDPREVAAERAEAAEARVAELEASVEGLKAEADELRETIDTDPERIDLESAAREAVLRGARRRGPPASEADAESRRLAGGP